MSGARTPPTRNLWPNGGGSTGGSGGGSAGGSAGGSHVRSVAGGRTDEPVSTTTQTERPHTRVSEVQTDAPADAQTNANVSTTAAMTALPSVIGQVPLRRRADNSYFVPPPTSALLLAAMPSAAAPSFGQNDLRTMAVAAALPAPRSDGVSVTGNWNWDTTVPMPDAPVAPPLPQVNLLALPSTDNFTGFDATAAAATQPALLALPPSTTSSIKPAPPKKVDVPAENTAKTQSKLKAMLKAIRIRAQGSRDAATDMAALQLQNAMDKRDVSVEVQEMFKKVKEAETKGLVKDKHYITAQKVRLATPTGKRIQLTTARNRARRNARIDAGRQ